MKSVPYRRPIDTMRHRTQFSRHGNLAPGICATLRITMRHIYLFRLSLCSCLVWRRMKWKVLCSARRNKELWQNCGRKAWTIETTSTAMTLTGRKCYENGPPKNVIVWQVGFVWSTMGTIAGWTASLDVVITFLRSWTTVGVWRKAVHRRVVFICEKCLLSSSIHRSGSIASLPAAETAYLRTLSMHLHIHCFIIHPPITAMYRPIRNEL